MVLRIKAAVAGKTDAGFVVMARTDAVASEGLENGIERACASIPANPPDFLSALIFPFFVLLEVLSSFNLFIQLFLTRLVIQNFVKLCARLHLAEQILLRAALRMVS